MHPERLFPDPELLAPILGTKYATAAKIEQHLDYFVAASFWFFTTVGWQGRVPAAKVISRLKRLERTARSVICLGLAELNADDQIKIDPILLRTAQRFGKFRSRSRRRLGAAVSSLRRMLERDEDTPDDEFGDRLIASALCQPSEQNECALVRLSAKILDNSCDLVCMVNSAYSLHLRARRGQVVIRRVRRHTVNVGNSGDAAMNSWIESMICLYWRLTDRDPGTSIADPTSPRAGKADGPLIRFLDASFEPLLTHMQKANELAETSGSVPPFSKQLLNTSTAGWRARIRTWQKNTKGKTIGEICETPSKYKPRSMEPAS